VGWRKILIGHNQYTVDYLKRVTKAAKRRTDVTHVGAKPTYPIQKQTTEDTPMTKKQRGNHLEDIINKIKSIGFTIDRWGNFKKEVGNKVYRFKLQKTSLRYELKSGSDWRNIVSDYFSNITIIGDGIEIKGKIVK
jgi:hypothetical protein